MNLKRRSFLISVGAAGGVRSRSVAASPNAQVAVAVVGVRGMGGSHLRDLLKRPSARVVAVCDVDQNVLAGAGKAVTDAGNSAPKLVSDFRRILDDATVDAVVIATPHHWHAPIAVRALQAGKDVYVEKPMSHVYLEGKAIVEAARKYNRVVQHGTQMRSSDVTAKAREVIASGVLGEIKMSKAWNVQRHSHRTPVPDAPTPPGVDYDLWLGPAPRRPFNPNRFHGNWQWYRDYGNGDIGNDGIHDLDMACFGLGVDRLPIRITAHGSRLDLTGEREFPDNMLVAYQFDNDRVLIYEDRGWAHYGMDGYDSGNAFYGTKGYMMFTRRGFFQVYLDRQGTRGPTMRGNTGSGDHMQNFLDCVRSRQQPNADALTGHRSCALVHLGEVAYRVQRVLRFDPRTESVIGDREANALLTKEYRKPWELPKL